jgi:hypothetical protein
MQRDYQLPSVAAPTPLRAGLVCRVLIAVMLVAQVARVVVVAMAAS